MSDKEIEVNRQDIENSKKEIILIFKAIFIVAIIYLTITLIISIVK